MTLVPRGSKWGVKVWDPGTRKYRWVGTYETEAEAIQAERDAKLQPGRDMPTIEQWARIWLSDYARQAKATQRSYRYSADRIVKDVGKLKLDALDRPRARKLANAWPRSVTLVARTMWADAVRDGVAARNPFTGLRLESPRGRKDLDALTEEEMVSLGEIAYAVHEYYGPEAKAIILTLGFTGVRPGELCALRRDDLDVSTRELTVRWNLDGLGQTEKLPKNGKPRTITVPPVALRAILDMPPRPHFGRNLPEPQPPDYLFHSITGKRLSKGTLGYVWRDIATAWKAQGGRDIDLYDLRHACATWFLERGATPADVACQLGHSDGGRLVCELYGHPDQSLARDRLRMAAAEQERPTVTRRDRRIA